MLEVELPLVALQNWSLGCWEDNMEWVVVKNKFQVFLGPN